MLAVFFFVLSISCVQTSRDHKRVYGEGQVLTKGAISSSLIP